MVIYDRNIRFEINVVNESKSGDTFLFDIVKTVFGDLECNNATQQYNIKKRLYVDDEGNVYTSKIPKQIWFLV